MYLHIALINQTIFQKYFINLGHYQKLGYLKLMYYIRMKTYKLTFVSVLIFLLCVSIKAQQTINLSWLEIGEYYKITLIDGWQLEGKLTAINENSIIIKTDLKSHTIKKEDIKEVTSSGVYGPKHFYDNRIKIIELKDGSELIGYFRKSDSLLIKFETLSGATLYLKKEQIASVEKAGKDEFLGEDPNKSRLLFAPTGRTLSQGKGYVSVNEIFFPMVTLGVTDFITIGGGISIFPGTSNQLYYFNAKVRAVHTKDFDVSAGALYSNIISNNDDGLGTFYGMGTYSVKKYSLSLGGGFEFTKNAEKKIPLIIVGGEIQTSKNVKLISENWIPVSSKSIKFFSLGVRVYGKKLAGDFGFVYPIDDEGSLIGGGFPFIPWVGLNYNFNFGSD